ncbi:hypothetical protein HDU76_012437 [Blyttiomyces sp. JEL0837]|nr:hypothetical protein HDU76_012437 [Blyttiomyces sp. JEL0837]
MMSFALRRAVPKTARIATSRIPHHHNITTLSRSASLISQSSIIPATSVSVSATSSPITNILQKRNIYKKPKEPILSWTREALHEKILDLLFDYAQCPQEQISLEANLEEQLLIDSLDRFGFQWDLQNIFQFDIPPQRRFARDLKSGREAADWVMSILEEDGRPPARNAPGLPRMSKGLPSKRPIPRVANVIAVSSAKGGVGKSTTAVNLAVALTGKGLRAGILDADVFGPSIPLMMNLSGMADITERNSIKPMINYGTQCMSMGFLVGPEQTVVWRGLMVMKGIQQLLFDVEWTDLDVLVIDMPPGTGDTQLSISQLIDLNGAVVVSTPQDVALADAKKGIEMFKKLNVPILGLVQNMSFFCCPNCSHETEIFGPRTGVSKVAEKLGIEVIANVPLNPEICEMSDVGTPIVVAKPDSPSAKAYVGLAEKVVEKLNLR